MRWTIAQVAEALDARPGAGLDALARVAGVSIDSRAIRAGELFIAIHGPRHDGHDHVASALESGAIAAVVRGGAFAIRGHSQRPLHCGGRHLRCAQATGARSAKILGGKLPASQFCRQDHHEGDPGALLGAKLRVLKSEGNFNNEYGLPLTLLRLEETHQAAVLEMGMSRRGELARLTAIAKPDVGVVTRVSPAHLEFFASVDEIALAKRELIEGLKDTSPPQCSTRTIRASPRSGLSLPGAC